MRPLRIATVAVAALMIVTMALSLPFVQAGEENVPSSEVRENFSEKGVVGTTT
jgi:hypothetical protein